MYRVQVSRLSSSCLVGGAVVEEDGEKGAKFWRARRVDAEGQATVTTIAAGGDRGAP
jgi:hypothetical protein